MGAPLEEALVAGDGVEEVTPAARLAGADVAPDGPEGDDDAARHVLAAVVACALDDGLRVGVAHAEALARAAVAEELAAGRAVEAGVADDGAVRRGEGGREAVVEGEAALRVGAGQDADAPAVQRLADVVVGVAAHLVRGEDEGEGVRV